MATSRASGYVVTHTVWNAVLSRLTDDGVTFSGNFNGGTIAASTGTFSGALTASAALYAATGVFASGYTSPGSGSYAEAYISGGNAIFDGYNYTGAAYLNVILRGLTVQLNSGTTQIAEITSSALRLHAGLRVNSSATVATLSNGNNNDLDPGSRVVVQYTTNTSNCDITGFSGGADGRILLVCERSNLGGTMRIMNENASSTAANRITTVAGSTLTLGTPAVVMLIYDGSASRWLCYEIA